MARIINDKPHPSVVKQCICKNCGVTIEYVPRDVRTRSYGEDGILHYISCLNCKKDITVRG